MDFQIYLIVLLFILVIYLSWKKFIIKNKFNQYIIENGGKAVDSIKNNEDSFYDLAKLLNKRYKIDLLNAYTVVNSLKDNNESEL